jgi:hypothetical protein
MKTNHGVVYKGNNSVAVQEIPFSETCVGGTEPQMRTRCHPQSDCICNLWVGRAHVSRSDNRSAWNHVWA